MLDKKAEARPGSLDVAHDASVTWRYLAPAGTTLEMCLRPDYWGQCTRELGQQRVLGRHAWNRVEILAEDGSWEAELRVMSIDKGLVTTRLLREWSEPQSERSDAGIPEGYKVEHIPGNGWRAMDAKSQVILEKQTDRAKAVQAAAEHGSKAKGGK